MYCGDAFTVRTAVWCMDDKITLSFCYSCASFSGASKTTCNFIFWHFLIWNEIVCYVFGIRWKQTHCAMVLIILLLVCVWVYLWITASIVFCFSLLSLNPAQNLWSVTVWQSQKFCSTSLNETSLWSDVVVFESEHINIRWKSPFGFLLWLCVCVCFLTEGGNITFFVCVLVHLHWRSRQT